MSMTLEQMQKLPPAEQEKIFRRLNAVRKKAKVTNYSATYGVGKVKLARTTGMSEDESKKLLAAFWEMNWSVKSVADSVKTKTLGGKKWLFNPVSRFWIQLRYDKDIFSSLNQSTGVYCFDTWLAYCWAFGIKGIGQFHDEVITPVGDNIEQDWMYETMKEAIKLTNEKLNLNVPLDVDPKFGVTYAEIH